MAINTDCRGGKEAASARCPGRPRKKTKQKGRTVKRRVGICAVLTGVWRSPADAACGGLFVSTSAKHVPTPTRAMSRCIFSAGVNVSVTGR